ncbi:DUF4955 domain-containing protein [Bacteroides sp. ET225]|uniref:DUF4955 domain-containing protein n=1 Tax=Bacteroides sp. ET225 TaxID=2972461 RepID=UPI0021ACAE0C|nr:DUF4955 domain-containing protein [Bacteroides sp. ET225]MCR8919228.1 DUF4955 domain-containing protein [Bacteroides sp. ET225]
MSVRFLKNWMWCLGLLVMAACSDEEVVQDDAPVIPEQPAEIASVIDQYNADIAAMQALFEGDAEVVNYTQEESGAYRLELSDGKIATAVSRTEDDADIPLFGVNEEGYWTVQLNGESGLLTDMAGNSVPALRKTGKGVYTPQVALGEDGYWQVSLNGNQWKRLSDAPAADMTGKTSANFSLYKSVEMDGSGQLTLSLRNGEASVTVDASASSSAEAWKKFVMGSEDNVLLDYSYAGYMHGEVAPADGFAWGYKVYNVLDYGADPTGKESSREALLKILRETQFFGSKDENLGGDDGWKNRGKAANMVVYFPAGRYILHNNDDNDSGGGTNAATDEDGNNRSTTIFVSASNFIIKGDGPESTVLVMETPNLATDVNNTGSSPELIKIGQTNSPDASNMKLLASVTGDSPKGAFSVQVDNTSDITVGSWVQLRLRSHDPELVKQEVGPIPLGSNWTINGSGEDEGVKVTEFHQVKSKTATSVTFVEPIMHEVNHAYGWEIKDYKYLENVGVEDLAFEGNALDGYSHHGDDYGSADKQKLGWQYDGAYKPLVLSRVVNSWVRNVKFTSVSEAVSINESANSSAYNIVIDGTRGHSAVRSQHSTRVFIGAVKDASTGSDAKNNPCEGQFHSCGVSKPSIGTVVWNCEWGKDACFESHATQPRATLIDMCRGGLVRYRAGGAEEENPNHLADLTLWNLYVTGTSNAQGSWGTDFKWWAADDTWWKIYPPIVVGVHGASVDFTDEPDQLTYEESTGAMVTPESLYEAQLERRLGYVPAWLNAIK